MHLISFIRTYVHSFAYICPKAKSIEIVKELNHFKPVRICVICVFSGSCCEIPSVVDCLNMLRELNTFFEAIPFSSLYFLIHGCRSNLFKFRSNLFAKCANIEADRYACACVCSKLIQYTRYKWIFL